MRRARAARRRRQSVGPLSRTKHARACATTSTTRRHDARHAAPRGGRRRGARGRAAPRADAAAGESLLSGGGSSPEYRPAVGREPRALADDAARRGPRAVAGAPRAVGRVEEARPQLGVLSGTARPCPSRAPRRAQAPHPSTRRRSASGSVALARQSARLQGMVRCALGIPIQTWRANFVLFPMEELGAVRRGVREGARGADDARVPFEARGAARRRAPRERLGRGRGAQRGALRRRQPPAARGADAAARPRCGRAHVAIGAPPLALSPSPRPRCGRSRPRAAAACAAARCSSRLRGDLHAHCLSDARLGSRAQPAAPARRARAASRARRPRATAGAAARSPRAGRRGDDARGCGRRPAHAAPYLLFEQQVAYRRRWPAPRPRPRPTAPCATRARGGRRRRRGRPRLLLLLPRGAAAPGGGGERRAARAVRAARAQRRQPRAVRALSLSLEPPSPSASLARRAHAPISLARAGTCSTCRARQRRRLDRGRARRARLMETPGGPRLDGARRRTPAPLPGREPAGRRRRWAVAGLPLPPGWRRAARRRRARRLRWAASSRPHATRAAGDANIAGAAAPRHACAARCSTRAARAARARAAAAHVEPQGLVCRGLARALSARRRSPTLRRDGRRTTATATVRCIRGTARGGAGDAAGLAKPRRAAAAARGARARRPHRVPETTLGQDRRAAENVLLSTPTTRPHSLAAGWRPAEHRWKFMGDVTMEFANAVADENWNE